MFCPNCGVELKEKNQRFCHGCGVEVSKAFTTKQFPSPAQRYSTPPQTQLNPVNSRIQTSSSDGLKKMLYYSKLYTFFSITSFLIALIGFIILGPYFIFRRSITAFIIMGLLHTIGFVFAILSRVYHSKSVDKSGVLGIFAIILNAFGLITVIVRMI